MLRVAASLLGALFTYCKIGWWGLVTPRLTLPLVVAQAVIRSEKGLLLAVRSDLRGWELPGGAVEPGESPEDAVCREVLEETGLEVSIERFVGDYIRTGFGPHTAKVYRCRVVGGALQRNWETLELRWFDTGHLPETLFPWFRDPIQDAEVIRAGPVVIDEEQGVREILAAIRIDLRMRVSENRAA